MGGSNREGEYEEGGGCHEEGDLESIGMGEGQWERGVWG